MANPAGLQTPLDITSQVYAMPRSSQQIQSLTKGQQKWPMGLLQPAHEGPRASARDCHLFLAFFKGS